MAMRITDETLMGTFEQKRELVQSFTMFDDDFFAMVMEDKASCQEALRVLTGIQDLVVKSVKTQYSIRNLGTHSVILDTLAEDSNHKLYNIELQVANRDDHQKRVRYYQSNIDISYLDKGEEYERLPELYLIYMTRFDLFKLGKASYTIDRVISGTDVVVDNGVHELYVNAANDDQSQVAALMKFFISTKTTEEQFPELSRRIRYFKEEQEGVSRMCEAVRNYGDEKRQQGIQQGIQQGMEKGQEQKSLEIVRQAVKMGMDTETIAKLVSLPVEQVQKLIGSLDK